MITKPSIGDLLEGASRTLEHVVLLGRDGVGSAEQVTDVLGVLDRVAVEWPDVARHLAADNRDIDETLRYVVHLLGPAANPGAVADDIFGGLPALQHEDGHPSPDALAEMNRRLRASLVHTIDVLDLPADSDGVPAAHEADAAVRDLIVRMLRRELDAAPVVPVRVNPTSGGGVVNDPPERVAASIRDFLVEQMPNATEISVTDMERIVGGASREAWIFEASWDEWSGHQTEKCVMLRHPVASVLESDEAEDKINGSRRLAQTEFKLIRLMELQGIPVPHMLWVDAEGKWLERPFSVSRWLPGTADFAPVLGTERAESILDQYIGILARLHSIDPKEAGVDFLGDPTPESAAMEQVELFEGGYDRQRLEDFPAITFMIRWLKKNQPAAPRVSVVHGDFRLGNFMYDGAGIVAMLDWEQSHLGDPREEIAFMYWALWSLESVIPLREFLVRYEHASGIAVDHDGLAWYRVFIELKMCVVILTGIKSFFATADRQLRYGGHAGFETLTNSQLRVMEALVNGGPTIDFGQ